MSEVVERASVVIECVSGAALYVSGVGQCESEAVLYVSEAVQCVNEHSSLYEAEVASLISLCY